MKSVQFKRKESLLRIAEEENRPKKPKTNWDRVIYFAFLAIVLFFVGRWGYYKLFFVEGFGQVLFENVEIRDIKDTKIAHFYVHEGDEVQVGDTLFKQYVEIETDGGGVHVNLGSSRQLDRDVLLTQKQIRIKQSELNGLLARKEGLAKTLADQKQKVILELIAMHHLDNTRASIDKVDAEILEVESEIAELRDYLILLKAANKAESQTPMTANININHSGGDIFSGRRKYSYYLAPIAGTVTKIFKQEHETALKSETILSIHKAENIFIKAYIDQEDLESLKQDDIVNLRFADGSKSKGVIKRFYYATYRLPEEFQNKYEPTTRTLAADIYPLDESETQTWKAYYKMSVNVRKRKF